MSVEAYITAGQVVVPALMPDDRMRAAARQIGLDESELFCIDVPAGMSRHLRASIMVQNDLLADIYASNPVTLTLKDSGGTTLTFDCLYARPHQPLFWNEQGGVALIELVDQRWWWQFTNIADIAILRAAAFSSDGRWQVNATEVPPSSEITTTKELWDVIGAAAVALNLTMPTTNPATTDARRLSDLFGTQTVSMAVALDAIAIIVGQVIQYTGCNTQLVNVSGLKSSYDTSMDNYKRAMRGGMQPTNGPDTSTDVLVDSWQESGYEARAPRNASVVMPFRAVEGRTYYDNCTLANVPAGGTSFCAGSSYLNQVTQSFTRMPLNLGCAYLPESPVVVRNASGGVLTSAPGWSTTSLETSVRNQYVQRYSTIPFGRTLWAGWVPWQSIGQIGNVSYRLAMLDGKMSPYTITTADETDWIFGSSGRAICDPRQIIAGKGLTHSYRNLVGSTIVDSAPPNTRIFPARITGSVQIQSLWVWAYSFVEVEPNPDITSATSSVSVGSYGRSAVLQNFARNMAENGNVFLGAGNANNVIAPGVLQSDYAATSIISAVPIRNDTIVMMCEHFPTASTVPQTLPAPPQYWFSMPNAVNVFCIPQQLEGGGLGEPEPV